MIAKASMRERVVPGEAWLQAVAGLFSVVSEPSMLKILQVLQKGPATVGQIIAATGSNKVNASKQPGIPAPGGGAGPREQGNPVQYSIRLPLVFNLSALVCTRLQRDARDQAQALP